jgi:hypothetical protein
METRALPLRRTAKSSPKPLVTSAQEVGAQPYARAGTVVKCCGNTPPLFAGAVAMETDNFWRFHDVHEGIFRQRGRHGAAEGRRISLKAFQIVVSFLARANVPLPYSKVISILTTFLATALHLSADTSLWENPSQFFFKSSSDRDVTVTFPIHRSPHPAANQQQTHIRFNPHI